VRIEITQLITGKRLEYFLGQNENNKKHTPDAIFFLTTRSTLILPAAFVHLCARYM
jgi:hypothetical protein